MSGESPDTIMKETGSWTDQAPGARDARSSGAGLRHPNRRGRPPGPMNWNDSTRVALTTTLSASLKLKLSSWPVRLQTNSGRAVSRVRCSQQFPGPVRMRSPRGGRDQQLRASRAKATGGPPACRHRRRSTDAPTSRRRGSAPHRFRAWTIVPRRRGRRWILRCAPSSRPDSITTRLL